MDTLKEAMYYEKKENNKVLCRLCPNYCYIPQGKRGSCGVRENIEGMLYSLNYGKISALALDPIEKKPLYNFHPGSSILSAGSLGCNFKCPFCQNYSIARLELEEVEAVYISSEELVNRALSLKDKGNIGIAYTYNEPTVWYEYILDTAKLAVRKGLVNVLVTNGYISPEPLKELLPYIHAMNIDLKGYTSEYYRDIVKGNLEAVKSTIEISSKQCHVEITTLIVPELNDSPEVIEEMAKWISSLSPDIPLHLSRFFPRFEMADKIPTPIKTLYDLKVIAEKYLNYVFIGNV
ncbi:MAG: AmmeMemoRadiSam system radical SAM enzyme [Solirubrobacterales bacterium]